jgi:hypothetical protein
MGRLEDQRALRAELRRAEHYDALSDYIADVTRRRDSAPRGSDLRRSLTAAREDAIVYRNARLS